MTLGISNCCHSYEWLYYHVTMVTLVTMVTMVVETLKPQDGMGSKGSSGTNMYYLLFPI